MKYYAGIGSRETPIELNDVIILIAKYMHKNGYTLRSGGAPGADTMFENAIKTTTDKSEIYLPWRNFNGNKSRFFYLSQEAYKIAEQYHPSWNRLSEAGKKLMARNTYQVLGYDLNTHSELIICWTPNGKEQGGTSQAMRIAKAYNIPIVNLYDEDKAYKEITRIVKKQTLF